MLPLCNELWFNIHIIDNFHIILNIFTHQHIFTQCVLLLPTPPPILIMCVGVLLSEFLLRRKHFILTPVTLTAFPLWFTASKPGNVS